MFLVLSLLKYFFLLLLIINYHIYAKLSKDGNMPIKFTCILLILNKVMGAADSKQKLGERVIAARNKLRELNFLRQNHHLH